MNSAQKHTSCDWSQASCVKWANPSAELAGIARVAHALVDAGACAPKQIGFAVPNATWAAQTKHACNVVRLASTSCLPVTRLGDAAREALASLDVLTSPNSEQALAAYMAFGHSADEVHAFVEKRGQLHGLTLMNVLGMQGIPEFEHALRHMTGDEDAAAIARKVRTYTATPAIPSHVEVAPIMDFHDVAALGGSFTWLFAVGCVNGMMPGPAAFSQDAQAAQAALDADREAFAGVLGAAQHVVVSSFERIEVRLADALHIQYARCKTEHGQKLAMCTPSAFLNEAGAQRPSTAGGQAFLRDFDLN